MELLETLKNAEAIFDLKLINDKLSDLISAKIEKKLALCSDKNKKLRDLSMDKSRLEYVPFRQEVQKLRTQSALLEKNIADLKKKKTNIFNRKSILNQINELEGQLSKVKLELDDWGKKTKEQKDKNDAEISQVEIKINSTQHELDSVNDEISRLRVKKNEAENNAKVAEKAFYDYLLTTEIYKSYHSYQAVCQFIQYIESGRCNELVGPYGCYNLYETELRSGLIISNLVEINQRLSEIQQTMNEIKSRLEFIGMVSVFMLQELQSIDSQLASIGMNTSAIAMCSAITAKSCNDINQQASEIKSIVKNLSYK